MVKFRTVSCAIIICGYAVVFGEKQMSKRSRSWKWLQLVGLFVHGTLLPGWTTYAAQVSTMKATDGMAWDGEHLWFSFSKGGLFRATKKGVVLERLPTDDFSPYGLAFGNEHLWVCDPSANKIHQLNRSGRVVGSLPSPAPFPQGLTFDGEQLWVSCKGDNGSKHTVHCISTEDGTVLRSFESPHLCDDLASDGRFIWASCSEAHLFLRFLPSGEELMTFRPPCRYPSGLTFDGEQLWVVDHVLSSGHLFALPPPRVGVSSKAEKEEKALSLRKLFEKGEALAKDGEWMEAAEVWRECIESWPDAPEPYFNLAASLDWAGAPYAQVTKEYKKCLHLRPVSSLAGLAAYNSGLRALREGRFLDGVTFMQVAGKYYPSIQGDALFAAAHFAEERKNWDLATELYDKVAALIGEAPCRNLIDMTQDQEKEMLHYLAERCQSRIKVIQIKLLDSSLVTGIIVGGEYKGTQYGASPDEDLLLVKTLEDTDLEVDKKKIRFAKFVPKVQPPTLPRGLSLEQVSSSFKPFRPLRRSDFSLLSRQYAAEGRNEAAALRLAIATAKEERPSGRLVRLTLPKSPTPNPEPPRRPSIPRQDTPTPVPTSPPTPTPNDRKSPSPTIQKEKRPSPAPPIPEKPPIWKTLSLGKFYNAAKAQIIRYGPPVLGGALSLFVLTLLLVPPIQRKRTLRARVRSDFHASRGTQQLQLLQDALAKIESSIQSREKAKSTLGKEKQKAERKLAKAKEEETRGRWEREVKRITHLETQASAELDEVYALCSQVQQGIAALSAADISDFLKAVKGLEEARQKVSSHFLGLYPPWDDAPDWFERATKFGG